MTQIQGLDKAEEISPQVSLLNNCLAPEKINLKVETKEKVTMRARNAGPEEEIGWIEQRDLRVTCAHMMQSQCGCIVIPGTHGGGLNTREHRLCRT